ncbi:MAG: acetyl-CoA C-acyltransferase, partial [Nitrospinota bacterium]
AMAAGKFRQEIVPVKVPQPRGEAIEVTEDEGPRPDTSLEKLARLKPVMPDGVVTAGNASSQNDAAAVCLVVAEEKAKEWGLKPMAYLKGWAAAGVHPAYMGMGPVPAVQKLLARTGLSWDDLDLIELNEAFAVQVLAVIREWGLPDEEKLNVNGSGISLGHPIGATGARILTTLLYEMERRDARYGLETMCVGGGQGLAAIFERR